MRLPTRRRSRADAARSGRIALLLPLLLLAGLLALAWMGTPGPRRPGLLRQRPASVWLDPSTLAEAATLPGVDPRWGEELAACLARQPGFESVDASAREAFRLDLERLSFVARAALRHGPEPTAGLVFDLELRTPVACIPAGAGFLTVDGRGVLLSGIWPTPPRFGAAALPVLGPLSDRNGLFRDGRPGDWLAEPEHLDALDVALSMRAHLSDAERRGIGRVVIDARTARRASVAEPGIRIELEERRLILFGRAPSTREPGELDVGAKWRSVQSALVLLGDETRDWDLVDVRWDRPGIVLRAPLLALSGSMASGTSGARPR